MSISILREGLLLLRRPSRLTWFTFHFAPPPLDSRGVDSKGTPDFGRRVSAEPFSLLGNKGQELGGEEVALGII
jgi:hypothetical protein